MDKGEVTEKGYSSAARATKSGTISGVSCTNARAMRLVLSPIAAAVLVLGGCKDQAKESSKRAAEDVDMLADQIDKDVGEVERGLPEGAKKLSVVYAKGADPHLDVPSVRTA